MNETVVERNLRNICRTITRTFDTQLLEHLTHNYENI